MARFIEADEVRVGDTLRVVQRWTYTGEFVTKWVEVAEITSRDRSGCRLALAEGGEGSYLDSDNLLEILSIELIDRPETLRVATKADNTTTYVTSDSGGVKGQKVQRYDMIPTDALDELATRYGKGAEKYPTVPGQPDNWRLGYDWSLSFAAAYRHLTAAMAGEDIDPDSGDKHVTAVAWHMFALIHYMNDPERYGKYDDRQAVIERRMTKTGSGVS